MHEDAVGNSKSCISSTRPRYSSVFLNFRFCLSDKKFGNDFPDVKLYILIPSTNSVTERPLIADAALFVSFH